MYTVALLLTLFGGVMELLGVGLVVAGIVGDRRKTRALFARKVVRAGPGRPYASGSMTGTLSGGREPTTDERVAALEQRLLALEESVSERFEKALKRTDAKLDQVLEAAHARADELDAEMRRHCPTYSSAERGVAPSDQLSWRAASRSAPPAASWVSR